MTPRTEAGITHDADWRNLLAICESVTKEYGSTKGRVSPGIELLIKALPLLQGFTSSAIEAEVRADLAAKVRAKWHRAYISRNEVLREIEGEPQ